MEKNSNNITTVVQLAGIYILRNAIKSCLKNVVSVKENGAIMTSASLEEQTRIAMHSVVLCYS